MPASNSFPSASVKPRSAISPRSSGLLISMTSVQCPSPSAPIFTNLKIQATRPPQSKNRREKYPFGAPTPNLEPVPRRRPLPLDLEGFIQPSPMRLDVSADAAIGVGAAHHGENGEQQHVR